MNTTIKLTKELKDKLENLKLNPGDTYSNVIERLLKIMSYIEQSRGIRVFHEETGR